MKLHDLSNKLNSADHFKLYESQFGVALDINSMVLNDAQRLLVKVTESVDKFKTTKEFRNSENNSSYLQMKMMQEALEYKVEELNKSTKPVNEENMNIVPGKSKEYANALKLSAQGEDVSEACSKMRKQGVKEELVKVLENRELAIKFMRKIVESRSTSKSTIMEGDVENAQVVLAAQDIVDRVQKILEDMVDIQYKDIPSLADGVKAEMGVESATQFKDSMTAALQTLAGQLQEAKTSMENAVGVITGDEVGMPADMDLDAEPVAADDAAGELGGLDDLGSETDMDFDSDIEDLGRERR